MIHLGVDVWRASWPYGDRDHGGPTIVLVRSACGMVISTSTTLHGGEVTCPRCCVRMDMALEANSTADMIRWAS